MLCDKHVFKNGHALPKPYVLERTGYTLLGDLIRRVGNDLAEIHVGVLTLVVFLHLALGMIAHDGLAHEFHKAVCRLVNAGYAVKRRGLAGAVRAD